MAKPNYFEKQINKSGSVSYIFTKRLRNDRGLPWILTKLRRKMSATSEAEAAREALQMSNDLEHLQSVWLRDQKGHVLPNKDLNRAVDTLFSIVWGVDLEALRTTAKGHSFAALEAQQQLQRLREETIESTVERRRDEHEGLQEWLTPIGDVVLARINGEMVSAYLSDAPGIYFKQKQLDHLPPTHKAIRDIARSVDNLIRIVGDKPLVHITRSDVQVFIASRLEQVKTTSVQREIRSLATVWQQVAYVQEIRQLNPFSNQPIKALGTDVAKRHTPTIAETRGLIKALTERHHRLPNSYITPLVMVAALTGSRLNEIWGLERGDYHPSETTDGIGVLHIRPNESRANVKTKHSIRPFPVIADLAYWIDKLFTVKRPKTANSASAGTLQALKREGITFGSQSLRHGFKQRLVELDTPNDLIQELCGWSHQRMQDNYGFRTVTTKKAKFVKDVYDVLLERPRQVGNVYSINFG